MKHSFFVAISVAAVMLFSACKKDKKTIEETTKELAHEVGDSHAGGVIFYVDGSGEHGLIAATTDQGSAEWGCSGTDITGCAFEAIGKGQSNTNAILAECATSGIAARICDNLELNGYSDWYLPSTKELEALFNQGSLGNMENNVSYWTSSSFASTEAHTYRFLSGGYTVQQGGSTRTIRRKVRAIRSF